MLFDLPGWCVVLANVILIPFVHIAVSWYFEKGIRRKVFQPDKFPFRIYRVERECWIYENLFRVKSWKNRIPDGAKWFGGFEKAHLRERSPEFLEEFRRETCRGELAHWVQMVVLWGFVMWNPGMAATVMIVYGMISNLPCIVIQRYNRCRLERFLQKRRLRTNPCRKSSGPYGVSSES